MSRLPDLDYVFEPDDNQEKIADAWIAEGRRQERHRIETIISLDLLVANDVKRRLFDLINGGRRDDN